MNITKSLKLVGKVFEKIPITDIIFNKLPESVDEAERERIRSAIREAEHNREMEILDIFEERNHGICTSRRGYRNLKELRATCSRPDGPAVSSCFSGVYSGLSGDLSSFL